MLEGIAVSALLMKMIPYVIVIKVVGGVVDISTHYVKKKIGG
jgi:hypothetical protein